ncbi:MAG: alpha/beta fold hydrolase, partial [bacterium]|nr:alpha/beta fold hydrolase [bacterium]
RYKIIDKETYQQYIGDYRLEETNQILLFGRYQNTYMLYYMDGKRLVQIYNLYDDTFYSTAGERVAFIKAPTGGVTGVRFEKEGLPIVNGQRVELYKDEEITFTSGKYKLAGTLLTPLAQGPHPVVIFVAGSGRCDRESQRLAAAAYFARQGIAAFIYDKRGCGKSEGNWFKLTFEDRADDILAALSYLKGRSEIAADKIGLWGFSQGGWLTPLAASKSRDVAFIIPVAGAGISVAEQDLYNIRNQMAAAGFSAKVIDSGLNFMKYSYQLNRLDIPLLDNVFPAIDFYYEPVPVLEAVTQPVLAIWGGSDSCVPPVTSAGIFDRVLRKSGHDNFTLKIFPGADHGVRVFRHDLPWAVYPDGYLDGMVRWVSEICGNKITAPETNEGINNYKTGMDPGNEIIPGTGLPWYGGAAAQFGYIVAIMLLFLPAIILWPLGFLIRRIRKRPSAYPGAPLSIRPLAAVSGVLMITVFSTWLMNMFNFTGSDFSAIARLHDMTLLRIAAYLLIGITAGMVAFTVNTWKKNHRSLAFRIYYSILTLLSVLFIPWMSYWNLLF